MMQLPKSWFCLRNVIIVEQLKSCVSDVFENVCFGLGLLSRMNHVQKYCLEEKL